MCKVIVWLSLSWVIVDLKYVLIFLIVENVLSVVAIFHLLLYHVLNLHFSEQWHHVNDCMIEYEWKALSADCNFGGLSSLFYKVGGLSLLFYKVGGAIAPQPPLFLPLWVHVMSIQKKKNNFEQMFYVPFSTHYIPLILLSGEIRRLYGGVWEYKNV